MIGRTNSYLHFIITVDAEYGDGWYRPMLMRSDQTFTRSNGTLASRIYERLTKASRRRYNETEAVDHTGELYAIESAYRRGVYDAFKALQEELNT